MLTINVAFVLIIVILVQLLILVTNVLVNSSMRLMSVNLVWIAIVMSALMQTPVLIVKKDLWFMMVMLCVQLVKVIVMNVL